MCVGAMEAGSNLSVFGGAMGVGSNLSVFGGAKGGLI